MTAPTRPAPPILDVQKLLRVLLNGWLIMAIAVVAALVIGAIIVLRTPTAYLATAVVQVQEYEQNVVNIPEIQREALDNIESLKTIESNLASRPVLKSILESKTYGVTPVKLGFEAGREPSENELMRALRGRVQVELVRGTRLIAVSVEDEEPEFAAEIANAVVREFLRLQFEQRLTVSGSAQTFLVEEVERLRQKLLQSEGKLQQYLKDSEAVSLNESQNIIVEQLKELNQKVIEAKTERLQLEAAVAQIKSATLDDAARLLSITFVANAPAVQAQSREVAEMEGEVANLSERYLEKHPKLKQAQSQLAELREKLRRTILETAQSIDTQYAAALSTEQKFTAALTEQETKAIELNEISGEYQSLSREVAADRELLDAVQKRLKEMDITAGLRKDLVQVIEPAPVPDYPVKPRKKLIMAGAGLLGAMLGLALVLGRHFLDGTFRTVDEAESALGLRAFAAIPHDEGIRKNTLVLSSDPSGQAAEAIRTLRTSLALLSEQQVVLFTSALPGEGKSFCAMNYAVAVADSGVKTLLIDGDLRLPSLEASILPAASGARAGLSDVLMGKVNLENAVVLSDIPALHILCAGRSREKPAEVLVRPSLAEVLVEAAMRYERIVIDTAPVSSVSDALLLARHAEVVCLVIKAAATPQKLVRRVVSDLAEAGTPPSGIILNDLPMDGRGYYYHYNAGSYGSGVYGAAGPGSK